MSDRRPWKPVISSVEVGDTIRGYRDNDTRTYRIFVHKGEVSGHMPQYPTATTWKSCECCDLSFEDLEKLSRIINAAVACHEPWPEDE